ncbi:MAG: hypothetical protein HY911_15800 [Desulfobacterales bacterium]|nr:hypothetical protein [Desulfobacterales bacterium]
MCGKNQYLDRYKGVVVFYAILAVMLFGGGACAENTSIECQDWLSKSIHSVEEKPTPKRYQEVLQGVSRACPAIHESLRLAADKALKESEQERRAIILGSAAKPFLSAESRDFSSYEAAPRIAKIHPLNIAKDVSFDMLEDIEAGTYVFAWVLERQLIEGKLYTIDGQKLILNFLLSAAIIIDER